VPKEHRVKMIALAYRRLLWWIKWQAMKRGIVVVEVGPKRYLHHVSKCGAKMREVGHRRMRCTVCGFEAGRDIAAILNIEKRARNKLGNPTFSPLAVLTPS